MSKDNSDEAKPGARAKSEGRNGALLAGAAIGSAAVAAALLYASRRKQKHKPHQLPAIPSGEPPETD